MLCGCGGSGSAIDNNHSYDLTVLDTKEYNITVSGYAKYDGSTMNITGYTDAVYLGTDVVDSYTVQKRKERAVFQLEGYGKIVTQSVIYNYRGIPLQTETDGVACYLQSGPFELPLNATVGYESAPIVMSCDDGSGSQAVVRVETNSNVNANVIVSGIGTDGDHTQYTWSSTYVVDPNMQLISYREQLQDPSGLNMQIDSTKIVQ